MYMKHSMMINTINIMLFELIELICFFFNDKNIFYRVLLS